MYKYLVKGLIGYETINMDVVYYKDTYLHYDIRNVPDTIDCDLDQSLSSKITSIKEMDEIEVERTPELLDITFYADKNTILEELGILLFDEE